MQMTFPQTATDLSPTVPPTTELPIIHRPFPANLPQVNNTQLIVAVLTVFVLLLGAGAGAITWVLVHYPAVQLTQCLP